MDVNSVILQAESAAILGKTVEEIITPYAQYIILGIDVATGIVIAVSAAMAVIGFSKY